LSDESIWLKVCPYLPTCFATMRRTYRRRRTRRQIQWPDRRQTTRRMVGQFEGVENQAHERAECFSQRGNGRGRHPMLLGARQLTGPQSIVCIFSIGLQRGSLLMPIKECEAAWQRSMGTVDSVGRQVAFEARLRHPPIAGEPQLSFSVTSCTKMSLSSLLRRQD
jgi:hypothetical protein